MNNVTVIKPNNSLFSIDFRELFHYRELFLTLAQRDIKVRYKQTIIGGLWAILQPFMTMVVFSFFFGKIAKMPSDNIPYPIFSYSGLVLWTLFTNSLSNASESMVSNANIITKVYFPRIIIPISSTIVSLLDYSIASIIIFGLMIYFHFQMHLAIIALPLIVIGTWFLANGLGFWLAAINVKFRDVRFAIPFFIQLLIYATPVIYPVSVAGNYKWLVTLNPMTGYIEAHRALILGQAINYNLIGISLLMTILIFITGLMYFRSVERYFADII